MTGEFGKRLSEPLVQQGVSFCRRLDLPSKTATELIIEYARRRDLPKYETKVDQVEF
ncbi:hypothetical protein IPM62_00735 [Candidatus Woesebacteria bacterium]|nr:MAG: hypothetical protein IPM62_00735 [Candidatus Woesebacteria bacterium]